MILGKQFDKLHKIDQDFWRFSDWWQNSSKITLVQDELEENSNILIQIV